MRTKLRSKISLLFMAFAVMLALPAIALADQLHNDVVAGVDGKVETITAGGSTSVDYWITQEPLNQDGQAGCNPADGSKATVTISAPSAVTATPSSLDFTACSASNKQAVSFSSSTPGTYAITASVADTGTGSYSVSHASFTLVVNDNCPNGDNSGNLQDGSCVAASTNNAPTANAGGPYAFDEGSATNALDGSGTDTDGTIASYAWDLNYGTTFDVDSTDEDPNFNATNIDGPATRTVALKVTDDDGAESAVDTETVTIKNVDPTASNPSFDLNPVLGTATAGFSFSDASTLDTHGPNLSYFTWSDVGVRTASVTETNGAGSASDTRTLSPGCYNLTVTGTAVDDDGGDSDALSIYSNSQTGVYSKAFRPPIQDNERNIAKFGNVVPVKVQLTNPCTGGTVTTAALYITVAKGLNGEFIEDTNIVAESVSSADSGQQMRVADGGYIYNLSTKNLSANTDWAVRVRLGSATGPVVLQAVLYPKK